MSCRFEATIKDYIWTDADDRLLSKAWSFEDETERMVAERQPLSAAAILRAGAREQLTWRYGLCDKDFAD